MNRTTIARRMFARTPMARGVSPWVLHMKETKGQFTGIPIQERGKKLVAAYNAMPAKDKKALVARAKAQPYPKRNPKFRKNKAGKLVMRRLTKPRNHPWVTFCKANYKQVKHLTPVTKRFGALAELYRKAKK
jgi:hypothetical protein